MLVKLSRICKSLKLRCYVFLHGTIPPPPLLRACAEIFHVWRVMSERARVKLKDTPPPNTHPYSPSSPPLPQAGCVLVVRGVSWFTWERRASTEAAISLLIISKRAAATARMRREASREGKRKERVTNVNAGRQRTRRGAERKRERER